MSESTPTVTKKKSTSTKSKRSEKEKEKDQVAVEVNADEEMSETNTPVPKDKEKEKKKKKSSRSDRESKSTSTTTTTTERDNSGNITAMQVEETTTTTSSSSSLKTPTHNSNGNFSAAPLPMTPLGKLLTGISTPTTPSRLSLNQRIKDKEELSEVSKRLSNLLSVLEESNRDNDALRAELKDIKGNQDRENNVLRNRLADAETRLSQEIKLRAETTSAFENALSDLKNKEEHYLADRNNFETRLDETISTLTKEHSIIVAELRTDLHKRLNEIQVLKGDIKVLNADLLTKNKEQEEKTLKLLDAEYKRIRAKEEELQNIINAKDDDIKKIKATLKEKEKIISGNLRKESDLNQRIESLNRQLEDIRDSVNRDWEIKVTEALEEQSSRYAHLEIQARNIEDERQSFRAQIANLQQHTEDIIVKNNELNDKIEELNNELRNKDHQINTITAENEELKKKLHRSMAEVKNRDTKIAMMQDESNAKESKYNQMQTEMSSFKSQMQTTLVDPDVPMESEIAAIKNIVSKIEHRALKRQRPNEEEEEEEVEQSSSTSENNGPSTSANNATESLKLNTMCVVSIDTTKETIRLKASGDFENGLSITNWKIIVIKPEGNKYGFSFPANIGHVKGMSVVTVYTGRQRPLDVPTRDDEFYWNRSGLWDSPEGTVVQLVGSDEEVQETIRLTNGNYHRDDANKTDKQCLIM